MSRLLAHMYINYMILCGVFRGKPVNDNYSCVKPVKILYTFTSCRICHRKNVECQPYDPFVNVWSKDAVSKMIVDIRCICMVAH